MGEDLRYRAGRTSTVRIRWDRVALLTASVSTLLALSIRAALSQPSEADRPPEADQPAEATASPAVAPVCPATEGEPPLRSAPGTDRTVALTFDDGPGQWTPAVLDVLREYDVKATFFVVGSSAKANPETLAAIADDGHLIGNHTWSHASPGPHRRWEPDRLGREIERSQRLLARQVGAESCWFRPPQGVLAGAEKEIPRHGLRAALWSVDPRDWLLQSGASSDPEGRLARRIARAARPAKGDRHPVVLLHDGGGYRGATVAALPEIIDFYLARGYTFVRLDDQ